jgi:hypothetical protein
MISRSTSVAKSGAPPDEEYVEAGTHRQFADACLYSGQA